MTMCMNLQGGSNRWLRCEKKKYSSFDWNQDTQCAGCWRLLLVMVIVQLLKQRAHAMRHILGTTV